MIGPQYPDPDDILAWIAANGIMPIGLVLADALASIDALVGGMALDLDSTLDPLDE